MSMPFNVRSIAASVAVTCFFSVAIIGWISGLSSFTCCKRAIAGAVFGYVVGVLVVKIINAIVISAMVDSYVNKQRENSGAGRD
jgi:type III secretory pathway component EscU